LCEDNGFFIYFYFLKKEKWRRFMKRFLIVSILFLTTAVVKGGITYPDQAQYSAGIGENQATIVIDFDYENYFVFSYSWDGSATGWDALAAIEQAGALDVDAKWYEEYQSHFVRDFFYPAGNKFNYGENAITGWGYWGSLSGENWVINAGVDFRNLADGVWDSWVWSNYDFDISWDPMRGPGQKAVPEPATILLAGLGAIFAFRKRSNK
jgi:hypothetical protein